MEKSFIPLVPPSIPYSGGTYHSLSVKAIENDNSPTISLVIEKVSENKDLPIYSEKEFYNFLVNNIDIEEFFGTPSIDKIFPLVLSTKINMLSNQIAIRTRRGPANRMVISKRLFEIISGNITKANPSGVKIQLVESNDHTFVGYMNSISVYVDEGRNFPENYIFLTYWESQLDAGALLISDNDVEYLNLKKDSGNSISNFKDFYQILSFKF